MAQRGAGFEEKSPWMLSRNPTEICNPQCRYFRCGRKLLDYKRNPPWCNWVGAACTGFKCPYAYCVQMKLLPDGRCALFVKRKTEERERPEKLEIEFKIGAAERARKKLDKFGI